MPILTNLAGLAGQSNWYHQPPPWRRSRPPPFLPILTGQERNGLFPAPVSGAFPENVFTLLGGTYDVRSRR